MPPRTPRPTRSARLPLVRIAQAFHLPLSLSLQVLAQLIKQFALDLIFLEGGSLGRVVGVVASAEAALPWRLKMLATSAHVVSRCGRAGEWVLVLVLAVVPSCLLKCVNVSKAGETTRWVVLRRRLRILHKLATRADKGWPRCCQDLRLWHIQHCLHHGFFALAPVAHH